MKNTTFTIFSLLFVVALSWTTLVYYNHSTLGQLQTSAEDLLEPEESLIGKELYPRLVSGHAASGKKVYTSLGCASCHTQQVRVKAFGTDTDRGWGRVSVSRDYIREDRVLLGNHRIGPDLRNIGDRHNKDADYANWLHKHIYNARSVAPGSLMPSYPFLYKVRKIEGKASANQLIFGISRYAPLKGYQIVPTQDAADLVAYLMSLKLDYTLPEVQLQYLFGEND